MFSTDFKRLFVNIWKVARGDKYYALHISSDDDKTTEFIHNLETSDALDVINRLAIKYGILPDEISKRLKEMRK